VGRRNAPHYFHPNVVKAEYTYVKEVEMVRFTIRKYLGDDAYSWAVFDYGIPIVTGCSRREAQYHRDQLRKEKGVK
jgi:anti-sigma regulatory factor (Ser/Thr protein kinase)